MRKFIYDTFDKVYDRMLSINCVDKFFPDPKETRAAHAKYFELFYQSAATRCIQYEYFLKYLTHMPIIECSNYTPDLKPPVH